MTIARSFFLASLMGTAALAGGTAQAATPVDEGWYVGASAGRSDFAFDDGSGEFDEDSYAVHGGYRLNRNFALEAGHADLGGARFVYDCPAGLVCVPELYPTVVNQSFTRTHLALVGIVPVGERVELFAKVGFAQVRNDESVRFGNYGTADDPDDSPETVLGLGGRLFLSPSWALRLEWDRSQVADVEADGYWLGVEYRFAR